MDEGRQMEPAMEPAIEPELERGLGPEAVRSLAQRRLLWDLAPPPTAGVDAAVRLDRTLGATIGLAAGNAGGDGRVRVEAQTFVLSAEAWLDHGWRAPEVLAEQLSRAHRTLRVRGAAIDAAVEAHRAGVPWYLAASTSRGNAALSRAVGVGAAFAADPRRVALAASADAAVTHAERQATAASAALASIVAGLVRRDEATAPADVCRHVALACGAGPVRDLLELALASLRDGGAPARRRRWGVRAPQTLALALWCALSSDDPAGAVAMANALERGSRTAGAIAGALGGAIHGAAALPAAWRVDVEGAAAQAALARRLARAGEAPPRPPRDDHHGSDIWFLLDRSGSMQSIARDVVTGFDRFFAGQRAVGGEATVTIVQFDGDDPHDVLVDGAPLDAVRSIAGRFEPRGTTPLYDAIGALLDRAERRVGGDAGGDAGKEDGKEDGRDADQLVVILTDGEENASRHWTRPELFARIAGLRARGWTFVFLGANQDSYASGAQIGLQSGNVSNFEASPVGVAAAYDGLARTVAAWRGKSRADRRRDRDDFWGDHKEAEER